MELTLSSIEPADEAAAEGRFVLAIVRDVTETGSVHLATRLDRYPLYGIACVY